MQVSEFFFRDFVKASKQNNYQISIAIQIFQGGTFKPLLGPRVHVMSYKSFWRPSDLPVDSTSLKTHHRETTSIFPFQIIVPRILYISRFSAFIGLKHTKSPLKAGFVQIPCNLQSREQGHACRSPSASGFRARYWIRACRISGWGRMSYAFSRMIWDLDVYVWWKLIMW